MTAFYPVFLELRGRRAVVIGGGSVAEGKVRGLVAAGGPATPVSPAVTPALAALVRRNAIELKRRPYRRGDLEGAWLAIAAVNRSVSEAVWAEAEQRAGARTDLSPFGPPPPRRRADIRPAPRPGGKTPPPAVRWPRRIAGRGLLP